MARVRGPARGAAQVTAFRKSTEAFGDASRLQSLTSDKILAAGNNPATGLAMSAYGQTLSEGYATFREVLRIHDGAKVLAALSSITCVFLSRLHASQ